MKLIGLTGYKGSGKTTLAKVAQEEFGFVRMGFAGRLKDIICTLWPAFTYDQLYGEKKEEVVEEYGKSAREVMQVVGTDLLRGYDPDVWVRYMRQGLEGCQAWFGEHTSPLILDDLRFDNEAALVKELGGEVWKVVRRGDLLSDSHVSEQGVKEQMVDMLVLNSIDLEQYQANCRRQLKEFVNGR